MLEPVPIEPEPEASFFICAPEAFGLPFIGALVPVEPVLSLFICWPEPDPEAPEVLVPVAFEPVWAASPPFFVVSPAAKAAPVRARVPARAIAIRFMEVPSLMVDTALETAAALSCS
ncbi:hypothetical protein [Methylorubrum extorquens]